MCNWNSMLLPGYPQSIFLLPCCLFYMHMQWGRDLSYLCFVKHHAHRWRQIYIHLSIGNTWIRWLTWFPCKHDKPQTTEVHGNACDRAADFEVCMRLMSNENWIKAGLSLIPSSSLNQQWTPCPASWLKLLCLHWDVKLLFSGLREDL